MSEPEQKKKVPRATLQRYPVYLKALRKIKNNGQNRIMSKELSELVGIEPTTIRRDFSFFGSLGKQGYGYDVDELIRVFSRELGVNFDEKIILVGVGNLGTALLHYNNWSHVVGEIVCAFDINAANIEVESVPVYDLYDLPEKMPKGCRIAILCISEREQETVDLLVENGIRGIVSFAVGMFKVPDHVHVRHIDVVSSIQELVFETNNMNKQEG
ncbi:MAG: redox-sensing transcriptional repressor Rex [Solobacterium sp.]|nr:redox-sensing transcriptional repressor Rex [Solobacterium sp.]